ncbi:SGNH/GDSL hydrolase family protein [Patescibacteria group bacterium]
MKKIVLIYIVAFISSILLWNIIIANFIYDQSSEKESSLAQGKDPYSKFVAANEGYANFYTDNYGYNNDLIEGKKDDEFRILVLGDSITEAAQVKREDNFVSQLEKKLNDRGEKFRVLNFGRGGRALPDYIAFAQDYINALSPDYVVIQVNPGDFLVKSEASGNLHYITRESGNFILIKSEMDSLSQRFKYIKDKTGWLRPLVGYTAIGSINFMNSLELSSMVDKIKHVNIFGNQKSVDITSVNTQSESEQANYQLSREDLEIIEWEITKLIELYGKNIVFLAIPVAPYIENGEVQYNRNEKEEQMKKDIDTICAKYGIGYLDPLEDYIQLYKEINKMSMGFHNTKPGQGHLNKYGHEITAQKLLNFFETLNIENFDK